ncbi:MAG TPA: sugar ABC transporter ATP-binding protein [Clostridiales bacterium]|jgi:ribose transport system ATP-binding protein|nr:sugar ABC transporter ATP-binding protein [Clostridiales bacterium]
MSEVLLSVKGICKRFGPTVALKDVDFTLRRGEVHGLIGENGSGKSTLTSIIAGIRKADSGEMQKDGAPYSPQSAVDAQSQGVSMIVQEMGTAPDITVAENIFLGKEKRFTRNGLVSKKELNAEARKVLDNIGAANIPESVPTFTLNLEERKLVELAKAMYEEPDVLIVDETTTALSHDGRELLYAAIEKMRSESKGVIFISHDLEELMSVCNIMTVLRDGDIIGTLTKEEFDEATIKAMMVGRELTGSYYRSDYDGKVEDEVVLRAVHLTGAELVEDVNFELHRGEILGFGGLANGGIHELGRLLFGIDPAIVGSVLLADGTEVKDASTAVKKRMGYVSKNRDEEAIMVHASIRNNIALPSLSKLTRRGLVAAGKERELAKQAISTLEVKCQSMEQLTRYLSGGNKQKVVFGKWICNESHILILDCPTRGVDVGVKQAMYRLMYDLKCAGCSIILISEELPELIGMSDRLLILKNGKINGEFIRSPELSERDVIHAMI